MEDIYSHRSSLSNGGLAARDVLKDQIITVIPDVMEAPVYVQLSSVEGPVRVANRSIAVELLSPHRPNGPLAAKLRDGGSRNALRSIGGANSGGICKVLSYIGSITTIHQAMPPAKHHYFSLKAPHE